MPKRAAGSWIARLRAGLGPERPLYAQLYLRLRGAILEGSLPPGTRLPSTRAAAGDLGVSRTTAEEAYSQLDAEGYVVRRVGDGTYVADVGSPLATRPVGTKPAGSNRGLSRRGIAMSRARACDDALEPRPFRGGLPAVEDFPFDTWHRLLARRSRRSGPRMLGYGDPAGYAPLRESIAAYLATARGVRCSAAQVVVLTSSQQALDLAARLLVDPGDGAWLEDPGYPGARAALLAAGARVVPVPVDGDGLDVADGVRRAGRARLAYVTPSHQYPTGATLSLERRLALLAWARRTGAWIVEDDYDSEFRYDGRPLAAIQGLEPGSRVVYVGTFTKVLFPSLRLAYVVLPAELVVPFVTARTLLDGHTATLPQAVLADFIAEGHFAAHLRRMRALYRERRDVMVDAVRGRLEGALRLGPSEAGLHVTGHLDARADDRSAARRAARHGVETPPLSSFFLSARRSPGLVLGYAGLPPEAIRAGVRALAAALDPGGRGRPCRASSRAPATSPASAPGPRGR